MLPKASSRSSMSTAPTSTPSKQGKGKKEQKRSQPLQDERLKIVVRRLPPNLPEDIFWQSVLPWATEETTTWKAFHAGKLRKKLNKENIPSRAYIAFKSEEQLALFSHHYDGHTFRDKNGVESQAVVEFAPHPKIPSDKKKADVRSGTIEKDEDYISFIDSLKAAENVEPVSLEALIASAQPTPPPKTTPLLEALKAEKSAAKDKEVILRNHALYKQGDASARKEDKKKATASVPPPKVAPDANITPKKAKKVQEKSQVPDVQASGTTANSNKSVHVPKPVTQNGPSQSTRPSKPPKLRQIPPNKASTTTSGSVVASNATGDASALASAENQPVTASQPSRRARPVIASRQFEAALSIAGLTTSASDRRKREKVKDKVDDDNALSPRLSKREGKVATSDNRSAQASDVLGISVGLDSEKDNSSAQPQPPSPQKYSSKKGGRPGGAGHAGTQSSDVANPSPIKVPSILQRSENAPGPTPAILPRQTSSNADTAVIESVNLPPRPIPNGGSASPPRGRGRRGRGVGGRGSGGGRGGGRGGQVATAPREGG